MPCLHYITTGQHEFHNLQTPGLPEKEAAKDSETTLHGLSLDSIHPLTSLQC